MDRVRYRIPVHAGAPYLPLLRTARHLHAGMHTAFGFGGVEFDERR